jgi:hypothetical protein
MTSIPRCGCGCGQPCAESPRFPGTYTKYASDLHRKHASRKRQGKSTPPLRPPTHCACGCKKRLPPYSGRGKYLQFLPGHYRAPTRMSPLNTTARIPGDLTSAQIDAIIAHHKQVLRYERNKQS